MDEQRVREIVREEIEKVSDAYFSRSIDTPTRSAFLKLIRRLEEALVSRPGRGGVSEMSQGHTPSSVSLSAFTRITVGLNVSRMGEGYFVTAYRRFNQADERRSSFEISTEDFLEFADGVAKLAEAERLASPLEERVLAGEGKPERGRR